jgi:hypothetical protein
MRKVGYAFVGQFGAQLFFFFALMILADTGVLRSLGIKLTPDRTFLPLIFWWTTGFGAAGTLIGFAIGHARENNWKWHPLTLLDLCVLILVLAVLLALGRSFYLAIPGGLAS